MGLSPQVKPFTLHIVIVSIVNRQILISGVLSKGKTQDTKKFYFYESNNFTLFHDP